MMSVASRPRVKRHRSISVDDWKYFDQYRAFRPNPLVRLSILAPGTGPDRKRSDIVLQTSDRRPASSLTFRLRCVFPILYLCYLCSADIQDRTISRGFLSCDLGKLFN